MRANMPLMLAISVAVHFCVVGGLLFAHFHLAPPHATITDPASATIMDLQPLRAAPLADPVKISPARKVAFEPAQVMPLPPAPPKLERITHAAPPMPHLEANPNANVRVLPPEAVLSPTPPPQLDGANGVVFVLDISGSMYEPYRGATRLAFARDALAQRIRELKDGTPFAIVLYAQSAYASGPLVAAGKETRAAALRFVERDVNCGGGTNFPAGLEAAAELRTGSIVVATDGDLNSNAYTLLARTRDILGSADRSPALTIVGIAPRVEAGDDRLLENLTDAQGGTYLPDPAAPSEVVR